MSELPDALRLEIERDLRPVRPLPRPIVRVAWVAPWGILLLVLAASIFGVRADSPALGAGLTWIASGVQMCLGLAVVWAALQEAVPGTTLSRRFAGALFGTALVFLLALTWLTWLASPTTIRPGMAASIWRICVAGPLLTALPAFGVAGWLAARAFPLRPRLVGALYGLGGGLMADAGWRLFCHFSDPSHVLGAHGLAIVLASLAGVVAAVRVRP
jgi:hypothetical protein